jgi:hypothetical protein
MPFTVKKPQRKTYSPLRIWKETHAKWKAIAKHYEVTMTVILDQVAQNIINKNQIEEDADPEENL